MKRLLIIFAVLVSHTALADELVLSDEAWAPIYEYDADGSLFQRIADLEQEKILMGLERDRAQLQLDLDRLGAEKARIVREQENADMRAEEQAAEIERQRMALEQDRQKLESERQRMADEAARAAERAEETRNNPQPPVLTHALVDEARGTEPAGLAETYSLLEIIGAGNQLVATVEHLGSGQQRRLSVGRQLDGWTVRSISIDDGIEFEKGGEVVTIGIGNFGRGGSV